MNKSDKSRNGFMLTGPLARKGYDWWWHNFTGYHKKTGEAKAFFIEYFVCNPARGGEKPILGQIPANRRQPSYALIKAGCWGKEAKQIHNFHGIDDFYCAADRLDIKVADCTLTETAMKGFCSVTPEETEAHPEYMCDAGSLSWDLRIDKKIAFNVGYGASPLFRRLNAFEMFWHAEGIKTEYEGTVILDGEEYEVIPEKSFGYADKNWGADFTSPWLWISSCDLTSLLTGKRLENSAVEMELSLKCPKKEMLLINYEAPNGKKLHNRLWNGGTGYGEVKLYERKGTSRELIDHVKVEKAGCEYGEYGV